MGGRYTDIFGITQAGITADFSRHQLFHSFTDCVMVRIIDRCSGVYTHTMRVDGPKEFVKDLDTELSATEKLIKYYTEDDTLQSWQFADQLMTTNCSKFPDDIFYNALIPFVIQPSVLEYFVKIKSNQNNQI